MQIVFIAFQLLRSDSRALSLAALVTPNVIRVALRR